METPIILASLAGALILVACVLHTARRSLHRVAVHKSIHRELGEILRAINRDPALRRMWKAGVRTDAQCDVRGAEALDALFGHLFAALNTALEASRTDPDLHRFIDTTLDSCLKSPRVREWWGRNEQVIPPRLRKLVGERLAMLGRPVRETPDRHGILVCPMSPNRSVESGVINDRCRD